MKRWVWFVGILILVWVRPVRAMETMEIDRFDEVVEVREDGSLFVEERIWVDFGEVAKHGIIRSIPYSYLNQYYARRKIDLTILDIFQDDKVAEYSTTREQGNLKVKIGVADRTITGEHEYHLQYRVDRVMNYFEDHDELFWNVTGNDWPTEIGDTRVNVVSPDTPTQVECFTGERGSNARECQVEEMGKESVIRTNLSLEAGEGLTIVMGYHPGVISRPSWVKQIWWQVKDNWGYVLPVVTLVGMSYLYFVSGRDNHFINQYDNLAGEEVLPVGANSSIHDVYYPPSNLKPVEAGVLIDEFVSSSDLAALLIFLAEQRFLRIEEVEKKDYVLTKQSSTIRLKEYEAEFMKGLFAKGETVKLSSLKYSFAATADRVKNKLYEYMYESGYFVRRPDRVRQWYGFLGGVLTVAGLFLAFNMAASFVGVIPGIGLGLSGIIIMVFSFVMPKRTAKGRKTLLELLGFRQVIKLGDYRQQLFERHNYLTEILPFAIAFGLTKQWQKAVEKLGMKKPEWYVSSQPFSAGYFTRSMTRLSTSTAQTLTAVKTSSSSGGSGFSGGSSGGGFGGGGGGSW